MSSSPLTWIYENLEVGKDVVIIFDRARPPSKALLRRMSDKESQVPSNRNKSCDEADRDVIVDKHYAYSGPSESMEPNPLLSSPLPRKEPSRIAHSPNSVVLRTSGLDDWVNANPEAPILHHVP